MAFPKVDGPSVRGTQYEDEFIAEKPKVEEPVAPLLPPAAPPVWGAQPSAVAPTLAPDPMGPGVAACGTPAVPKRGWAAPQAEVRIDFDRDDYASATPEARMAQRKALEARKGVLHGRIMRRTEELDVHWRRATPTTKTDALRAFHERSRHLEGEAKIEVHAMVVRSTNAQRRVEELTARLTKPEGEEVTTITAQLADARAERDAAIDRATEVVDSSNLKVERLAIAERMIDPNAPGEGSGETLAEIIDEFIEVTEALEWVLTIFEDMNKARDERRARAKETARKELKKDVRKEKVAIAALAADYRRRDAEHEGRVAFERARRL